MGAAARAWTGGDECFREPALAADRTTSCTKKSTQSDWAAGGDSAGVQARRGDPAICGRRWPVGQRITSPPRLEAGSRAAVDGLRHAGLATPAAHSGL